MHTWMLPHPMASGSAFGPGAASFTIHAALIACAVYGSLHTKVVQSVGRLIIDVAVVQADAPRPPAAPTFTTPPISIGTLAIPTTVVPFIPPPSQAPFDASSFSGVGVEAIAPLGRDTARRIVSAAAVYAAEVLEERPERISGEPPQYPELLRNAGIGGRVRLEFVLDTAGAVERGSARVLESTHELFSQAALAVVPGWRFRPGRIDGRAVKVRVRIPVDFVKLPG